MFDGAQRGVQMCERPGFNCTGLPQRGGSCLAFGENAVLLRPFDESCHDCADPTATLTQWVLVVFLIAVITFKNWSRGYFLARAGKLDAMKV